MATNWPEYKYASNKLNQTLYSFDENYFLYHRFDVSIVTILWLVPIFVSIASLHWQQRLYPCPHLVELIFEQTLTLNHLKTMASVEDVPVEEPARPKTELEAIQMQANAVTDTVNTLFTTISEIMIQLLFYTSSHLTRPDGCWPCAKRWVLGTLEKLHKLILIDHWQSKEAGIRTLVALDEQGGKRIRLWKLNLLCY